jgi:polar amino acid transport system substrate-binding protein
MKKLFYFVVGILFLAVSVTFVAAQTNEECIALVEQTSMAIEENALQTLARINRAEHPYKNKDDSALYVFVLNPEQTIVGHPIKTKVIGKNMKGKPDIKGKLFRDEFVAVARKDGSGWVDYYFLNPKTKKEEHKTSFIKLVKGSDGNEYIVGSGKYYDE